MFFHFVSHFHFVLPPRQSRSNTLQLSAPLPPHHLYYRFNLQPLFSGRGSSAIQRVWLLLPKNHISLSEKALMDRSCIRFHAWRVCVCSASASPVRLLKVSPAVFVSQTGSCHQQTHPVPAAQLRGGWTRHTGQILPNIHADTHTRRHMIILCIAYSTQSGAISCLFVWV